MKVPVEPVRGDGSTGRRSRPSGCVVQGPHEISGTSAQGFASEGTMRGARAYTPEVGKPAPFSPVVGVLPLA
jgi:hypothetical protein